MPYSSALLSLFGRSPIKPLQEHMQSVAECVHELVNFFKAVSNENWVDAGYCYDELGEIFSQLYRYESGIRTVDIIFLYKTTELVGDLAVQAHKIGNQMQVIIAR